MTKLKRTRAANITSLGHRQFDLIRAAGAHRRPMFFRIRIHVRRDGRPGVRTRVIPSTTSPSDNRRMKFGIIDTFGGPRDLLLDFDRSSREPRLLTRRITYRIWGLCRRAGLRPHAIAWSRSRKGWHVHVHLSRRLTNGEIVAAQAILGSDRRRESLNLMRILAIRRDPPRRYWRHRWNVLFERKVR